jgi:hypothetical protein
MRIVARTVAHGAQSGMVEPNTPGLENRRPLTGLVGSNPTPAVCRIDNTPRIPDDLVA